MIFDSDNPKERLASLEYVIQAMQEETYRLQSYSNIDEMQDLLRKWIYRDLGYSTGGYLERRGWQSGCAPLGQLQFYSANHSYLITVVEGKERPSYLGGTASLKSGKGKDLADGVFCEGTWLKILHDMLSFEFK